ncbi:rRNA maturation RNase YbeY [Brevundimonas sp.]
MIEVEIDEAAWSEALPDVAAVVERVASMALGDVEGNVVILLADDAQVQLINGQFRERDRPTNVLSFPAPDSARPHLGDLILAYGVCAAEATEQGKSLSDHLSHLTIHGVLHLLGHDHEMDDEAEAMESEERRLLASLGIADPYRQDEPDRP